MATKKLKIKVGHNEQGDLFVESIQFCSQKMAESWGVTFSASFSTQVYDDHVNVTPVVRMRVAGPIAEHYIDVTHSPFTGAAIVFDIPQTVTDALFDRHKQAKAYFAGKPSPVTREMQDSDDDDDDVIVDYAFTEVIKSNSTEEFVDEDDEDYDTDLDDEDEDDAEDSADSNEEDSDEEDSEDAEPDDIDDFSDDVYDEKFE